ncbi:alpha/beta fold hydrolase [Candidatus Cyanaurora vandensis]|uniref:alpha/beta fold hydrolase n=1 Tax=Candidatus Cyanaurora vandensis TaxID=2714958 RepID=UPI00257BE327|nr:alpha/beta fold hydrolase [Candidatus Cyanaurora vandensis]
MNSQHLIEVGPLSWFYREAVPLGPSDLAPVLFLHGLPAQGYSWRAVLPGIAERGHRCVAPDWIGSGLSSKPEPKAFGYTPAAFLTALAAFVQTLELAPFHLVVQGFLGSVGIQYALAHPDQVRRLVILNAPLGAAKLPWSMQQWGLPLLGEMLTQDPILVDRTLEAGSKYQIPDADLEVYRRPFLKSSAAGKALVATIRNLQLAQALPEITTGLKTWTQPVLVAWGDQDPWLPLSLGQETARILKDGEFTKLLDAGHYPQEDGFIGLVPVLANFLGRRD